MNLAQSPRDLTRRGALRCPPGMNLATQNFLTMNNDQSTRYVVAAAWGNERFYFDDVRRSVNPQDVLWFTTMPAALKMLESVKQAAIKTGWRMRKGTLTIDELFTPLKSL